MNNINMQNDSSSNHPPPVLSQYLHHQDLKILQACKWVFQKSKRESSLICDYFLIKLIKCRINNVSLLLSNVVRRQHYHHIYQILVYQKMKVLSDSLF